ncbi:MAG: hypothetical protein KAH32_02545 [Chlamydiia bacterium]|nr:hypothetical protein [Chlamydiia bacterium]
MKFKVISSIALVSCAFFGSLSAASVEEASENKAVDAVASVVKKVSPVNIALSIEDVESLMVDIKAATDESCKSTDMKLGEVGHGVVRALDAWALSLVQKNLDSDKK